MKNYYEILQIPKNASDDEVKRAYRKLASLHHPDKGGSTEKFQEIEEAYRVLSDSTKRQEYDRPPQHHHFDEIFRNFSMQSGLNINDIHNIFNQNRKTIFRANVSITLEEAYYGTSRNVKLDTPTGTKYVNIIVPYGVDNTAVMTYDNIIPNLRLIVHFQLLKHHLFNKVNSNSNLEYIHNISIFDLILGTEINLVTINKRDITIAVPPKTNPSAVFRIAGYGMRINNSDNYGDLMIRFESYIPENINENIIDAISTYR